MFFSSYLSFIFLLIGSRFHGRTAKVAISGETAKFYFRFLDFTLRVPLEMTRDLFCHFDRAKRVEKSISQ